MDQLAGLRKQIPSVGLKTGWRPRAANLWSIAGGTGGCGKSTLAAGCALESSRAGRRVLLVDGDFHLAGLRAFFEVDTILPLNRPPKQRDLPQAIATVTDNLDVLIAKTEAEVSREIRMHLIDGIIHELGRRYDLIIIDAPNGFGFLHQLLALHSRWITFVITEGLQSFTNTYALIKLFYRMQTPAELGMVANRVNSSRRARELFHKMELATRQFLGAAPEFYGYVPEDPQVSRSGRESLPITQWEADEFFGAVRGLGHPALQSVALRNVS